MILQVVTAVSAVPRSVEAPAFTATVPTGFVTAMMHCAMPLRLGRRGGNSMGNPWFFVGGNGRKKHQNTTQKMRRNDVFLFFVVFLVAVHVEQCVEICDIHRCHLFFWGMGKFPPSPSNNLM